MRIIVLNRNDDGESLYLNIENIESFHASESGSCVIFKSGRFVNVMQDVLEIERKIKNA